MNYEDMSKEELIQKLKDIDSIMLAIAKSKDGKVMIAGAIIAVTFKRFLQ